MSITIKASITPAFGRHETFTPRYTWLKRGFEAIRQDPGLFARDDAHFVLGVGKNMSRSIRYWLQAMRVVEEVPSPNRRMPNAVPTLFGQALLDTEHGLDPYLESPGAWWLLHWMALSPGGLIPVWWSAFHTFSAVQFTTDGLLDHISAQISASGWGEPHPRTVRRDVLALIRCYAGGSGSRRADKVDDLIDAPFVPLGLLHSAAEHGWRFGIGPKPGLPPAIAAFACIDFLSRTGHTSRQQLIATLASETGGPGRAFKLTERDMSGLLHRAAAEHPSLIAVSTTAGSEALVALGTDSLALVAAQIAAEHFRRLGSTVAPPAAPFLPWSAETEERLSAQLPTTRERELLLT